MLAFRRLLRPLLVFIGLTAIPALAASPSRAADADNAVGVDRCRDPRLSCKLPLCTPPVPTTPIKNLSLS